MTYRIFFVVGSLAERFVQIVRKEKTVIAETVIAAFFFRNAALGCAYARNDAAVGAVKNYGATKFRLAVGFAVEIFKQ
mgnify:CR=1 FL=1